MTEQKTDLEDPRVLHRAAEHRTDFWAGVYFPELVERCVARAHAARARARGSLSAPVRQVLFVDAHDTGCAQIAAGLLAHHAGTAVVARSAGVDPGTAVDPYAVEVLAQHGTEPTGLVPKPVTEAVLRAADWVVTLGLQNAMLVGPDAVVQDWPPGPSLEGDQGPAVVTDLDNRVQALWVEISTSAASTPPRQDPRF